MNDADFYRGNAVHLFCGDWKYRLRWYDASGQELEEMLVLNSRGIYDDLYYWTIGDGGIDTALLDELLSL